MLKSEEDSTKHNEAHQGARGAEQPILLPNWRGNMRLLAILAVLAWAIGLSGSMVTRVAGDIGPGSALPPTIHVAGDIGPGS